MNKPSSWMLWINRFLIIIALVVVVFSVYTVILTLMTVQNNGRLKISTGQKNAYISISQINHDAKIIGSGKADVYLKPGSYQIFAGKGNQQIATVVVVRKKQTTTKNLKLRQAPALQSINKVDFEGFDSLLDYGLTTDQINTLKTNFFVYNTSTSTVSINLNSIQMDPHKPFSDQPFTVSFIVAIDSQSLKAEISHHSVDDIRLYLYNQSNKQLVFDSYNNEKLGVE